MQLTTAGADPRLAESIRIRARSATVSLATTTVEGGEFTFGRVPEGDYVVTVERETLAPDSILTSADSQTVTVSGRAVAVVVFSLRRATTRERLGVPPPPP